MTVDGSGKGVRLSTPAERMLAQAVERANEAWRAWRDAQDAVRWRESMVAAERRRQTTQSGRGGS